MSEPEVQQPEHDNSRFPLWAARRWYLYRLHRGSTTLALACTLLVIAALLPLVPIDEDNSTGAVIAIASVSLWALATVTLARSTRLLITGAPEHRHSATRLALGVTVPMLGAIGAGSAGVALVAFLLGHNATGALWIGVASITALIILALAMWACAEIARAAPKHPRTAILDITVNLAVILVLIALAIVVLALMSVLTGTLAAWIASILIALIACSATIGALSTRAIVGAIILARETAELGPEIEPVSGP